MGRAKAKGTRFERLLAKELGGQRVVMSGALKELGEEFTGDVKAYGMTFELKARANGFKQLYGWLEPEGIDALAIKADRKEALIVLPLTLFKELMEK